MEFQLRDFRGEDLSTLWVIDQECFPPGIAYSKAELAAYLRQAEFGSIAESVAAPASEKGAPAASAAATAWIAGFIIAEVGRRGVGHIITIDVVAKARRFGIGSRLLLAAEERLRVLKCTAVSLETAVDNVPALTFYKRHQYFVVRTHPQYYSNGLDALVLEKNLLSPVKAS